MIEGIYPSQNVREASSTVCAASGPAARSPMISANANRRNTDAAPVAWARTGA